MKDNLWFTYKARIQAQKRLEANNTHSQMLLVWYALLSVLFSVVSACHVELLGAYTGLASAVVAIVLLVVSILAGLLDFRGRSMAMRHNYLAIHEVYSSTPDKMPDSDVARYHHLLASCENHTSMDDQVFRVSMGAALTTRKPTSMDYVQVYAYKTVRFLVLATLYLAPVIAIVLLA